MRAALAAACLLLAGPVFGREQYRASPSLIPLSGIILFYNSQGPLSLVSMTRSELPPDAVPTGEVRGRSCQHGLVIPISGNLRSASVSGAAGDGSYRKAVREIRRRRPELIGIYDVKVDLHIVSILGIYRRWCTEISARGLTRAPAKKR